MTYYSNIGPYMDPNVFRSTSHPVYHVDTDLVSPRYVATEGSRSFRQGDYFREPLPGSHFANHQPGEGYRSDRRYANQYSSSSRDIDNLVRKYAITGRRDLNVSLTKPRTNQNVGVANSSIDRVTNSTLVQPKVCIDGRYPLDFSTPVALSNLMKFPESQLDRLLEEYDIPSDGPRSYDREFDPPSTRERLLHKLILLLGFLGARQIADVLRSGSGDSWSSSRQSLTGSFR